MSHTALSEAAVEWLVHGEHGLSSRTIFNWLLLKEVDRRFGVSRPYDPDDFRRCELLLRQVPELRQRLPEMASLSPIWRRLVERWDEVVALMTKESPLVFESGARLKAPCPGAYMLLLEIEREADAA